MTKNLNTFLCLILISIICSASSAWAMPKKVILIRHAEKTPDKSNIHLSEKGYARANALPAFFKKYSTIPLIRLVAQGQKNDDSSLRPIETLIPASKAFNAEINKQFVKDEANEMVAHLVSSSALDKKTVIVSWGHDELGEISQLLGKNNGEWSSSIFDRAWIFSYNAKGKLIKFTDAPQGVLPGDSED